MAGKGLFTVRAIRWSLCAYFLVSTVSGVFAATESPVKIGFLTPSVGVYA
jgi:hypothetical protein